AVTSTARSPSASRAARASRVESTPPEKATTTLSSSRRSVSSRSYLSWAIASTPLQAHQLLELAVAPVDLAGVQPGQAIEREVLDGERRHHRAVHHRPPHRRRVGAVAERQIAHEAAGERVTGPGRVEHRLQRVGRDDEEGAVIQQERAVLATLDHDRARAERGDLAGRLDQVRLVGELPRLAVVDGDDVDLAQ